MVKAGDEGPDPQPELLGRHVLLRAELLQSVLPDLRGAVEAESGVDEPQHRRQALRGQDMAREDKTRSDQATQT